MTCNSIAEVCGYLRSLGEEVKARRLEYFASTEDLEPGDKSLTASSACGFMAFYNQVVLDCRISFACSSEGWLCLSLWYSDGRRAGLWFPDDKEVLFAAKNSNGDFIGESEKGSVEDVVNLLACNNILKLKGAVNER